MILDVPAQQIGLHCVQVALHQATEAGCGFVPGATGDPWFGHVRVDFGVWRVSFTYGSIPSPTRPEVHTPVTYNHEPPSPIMSHNK